MPAKRKLPPIQSVRPVVIDPKLTPIQDNPYRDSPNMLWYEHTDYPNRPMHRGHAVSVHGWNDEVGMLVIQGDDRTNEALVTPAMLRRLADRLEADLPDNR